MCSWFSFTCVCFIVVLLGFLWICHKPECSFLLLVWYYDQPLCSHVNLRNNQQCAFQSIGGVFFGTESMYLGEMDTINLFIVYDVDNIDYGTMCLRCVWGINKLKNNVGCPWAWFRHYLASCWHTGTWDCPCPCYIYIGQRS